MSSSEVDLHDFTCCREPGSSLTGAAATATTQNVSANPQEDCNTPSLSPETRLKLTREAAGRSKTGVWGPTHSYDSDDERGSWRSRFQLNYSKVAATPTEQPYVYDTVNKCSGSGGSDKTNPQGSSLSSSNKSPGSNSATKSVGNTYPNAPPHSSSSSPNNALERIWSQAGAYFTPDNPKRFSFEGRTVLQKHVETVADYLGEACQPCRPRNRAPSTVEPLLGISPMESPQKDLIAATTATSTIPPELHQSNSIYSKESPIDRRRQRHAQRTQYQQAPDSPLTRHEEIEVSPNHHVQVNLPPIDSRTKRKLPVEEFEVKADEAEELNRSISELTMRSSYAGGETLQKIPDNRRMAYYAVGKHHRQSGRGGNRRCYFSGKLILGGAPFYAGTVQQGLRTLVVFCLPSSLSLPDKEHMMNHQRVPSATGLVTAVTPTNLPSRPTSRISLAESGSRPSMTDSASRRSLAESGSRRSLVDNGSRPPSVLHKRRISGNISLASKSMSRLSSLDDLSLSIDGDLDPNWGLDRDFLLKVLPPASQSLIKQLETTYPEQFETLPIQVRAPECWKLYVKFCFFSGLPIAEGEMHYKVRDDLADQVYGEEIILSHEVMEAVNGESADMLSLPNQKAFRYLRKHYAQQCSKLDDRVFSRTAWERVAPEV